MIKAKFSDAELENLSFQLNCYQVLDASSLPEFYELYRSMKGLKSCAELWWKRMKLLKLNLLIKENKEETEVKGKWEDRNKKTEEDIQFVGQVLKVT